MPILAFWLAFLVSSSAYAVEAWERNTFSYGYATGTGSGSAAMAGAATRARDEELQYQDRKREEQQRIEDDLNNQRSRW